MGRPLPDLYGLAVASAIKLQLQAAAFGLVYDAAEMMTDYKITATGLQVAAFALFASLATCSLCMPSTSRERMDTEQLRIPDLRDTKEPKPAEKSAEMAAEKAAKMAAQKQAAEKSAEKAAKQWAEMAAKKKTAKKRVAKKAKPKSKSSASRTCCKYCSSRSQPCGDSCISRNYTCHRSTGCAC